MKQKTALILSVGLTVFIIVVLSTLVASAKGIANTFGSQNQSSNGVQSVNQSLQGNINGIDPAQLLAGSQTAAISAQQAEMIAKAAALDGFTISGQADLVEFEGSLAYEVPFNDVFIYVDAMNGNVLFNGTVPADPQLITGSDAARIASEYMNRQDIAGVTVAFLNGTQVYEVVFSNRDAVFVSPYGVLLQVQLAGSTSSASNSNPGSSQTSQGSSSRDYEGEHDDD